MSGSVVVLAKGPVVSVQAIRANGLGHLVRVAAEITPDAAEETARALLTAARHARANQEAVRVADFTRRALGAGRDGKS